MRLKFLSRLIILCLGVICICRLSFSDNITPQELPMNNDLIGYWPLKENCKDHSGNGNHGINHGVSFTDGAASFNGIENFIEVPSNDPLQLKKKDFTISAWIHTEDKLTDVLGDILSKYDPTTRTGMTLSIMNYAGVSTAQSNYRNLSFGIDAGKSDKEWTDCGQLGNAKYVMALAVCEGNLYAGTYEHGEHETGHVFRYEGGSKWIHLELPIKTNGVASLASFNGKLYAGTAAYNAKGSWMGTSANMTPGGKIFRYDGDKKWTDCGNLGEADTVGSLTIFDGSLYASSLYKTGKGLYRYDGEKKWTFCGDLGRRPQPTTVFNGHLYAGSPDAGHFSRYERSKDWTDLGKSDPNTSQIYCFMTYEGKLHCGIWPTASVFSYNVDGNKWTSVGQMGHEQEVMGISLYNGKMYCGTLPLGKVYRYDGPNKWTFTGRLDNTPNVPYRRIWSMAVYQGKLFAGALPSGHVYCYEAGKCATNDHELTPGWRFIAAVKSKGVLKLYVDGKCVTTSTSFDSAEYDLSNSLPLKIGFGQHDYFNGKMKDLRLYQQALDAEEIQKLYKSN